MATGSVNINGCLTTTVIGTQYLNFQLPANASGFYQEVLFTYASALTANISLQPWAAGVIIIPPVGGTVSLALGTPGSTGGTPFGISPSQPTLISLPGGANAIQITTGAAVDVTVVQF